MSGKRNSSLSSKDGSINKAEDKIKNIDKSISNNRRNRVVKIILIIGIIMGVLIIAWQVFIRLSGQSNSYEGKYVEIKLDLESGEHFMTLSGLVKSYRKCSFIKLIVAKSDHPRFEIVGKEIIIAFENCLYAKNIGEKYKKTKYEIRMIGNEKKYKKYFMWSGPKEKSRIKGSETIEIQKEVAPKKDLLK